MNDTPIHRVTFLEMSDDEQIKFIEELRNRRQKPLEYYNELMELKKQQKIDKLKSSQEKAVVAFEKCLQQFDKKYEDLLKKSNKIKEITMELHNV